MKIIYWKVNFKRILRDSPLMLRIINNLTFLNNVKMKNSISNTRGCGFYMLKLVDRLKAVES